MGRSIEQNRKRDEDDPTEDCLHQNNKWGLNYLWRKRGKKDGQSQREIKIRKKGRDEVKTESGKGKTEQKKTERGMRDEIRHGGELEMQKSMPGSCSLMG